MSFFQAANANLMGLTGDAAGTVAPDMADFDFPDFLRGLTPARRIVCRHTVGLTDPLTEAEIAPEDRIGDGLPESLEANVAAYGLRSFKVKVGGDTDADIDRLCGIAAILDRIDGGYVATLDGNEQYDSIEAFADFFEKMSETPRLAKFRAAIKAIEQPIARTVALDVDLGEMGREFGFEIDEIRRRYRRFPGGESARLHGHFEQVVQGRLPGTDQRRAGREMECGTGQRRALLHRRRGPDHPSPAYPCSRTWRSPPCWVAKTSNATPTSTATAWPPRPAEERAAFASDRPDMYELACDRLNLKIADGEIALTSLHRPGFGT